MNQHRFSVGQVVDFLPGPRDQNVRPGKYRIERLLPSETGDLQYQVKHAMDVYGRVVSESQLAPGGRSAF
jgi:hypothetical protein